MVQRGQQKMATKRRLLWIGDAGVNTGFARCTHEILKELAPKFDVHVLALGYDGDSGHGLPWPIYRASAGGDPLGIGRVANLVSKLGPTVVVIQNDPWNFPLYLKQAGNSTVVGVVAVDGKNCRGTLMNGLASAIFWTKFGEEQARLGGYSGQSAVVPLGVDTDIYYPQQKAQVRERMNLPAILQTRGLPADTFIVGVVGRNQQRKRLDLTLEYFAEWIHAYEVPDAALWVQQAPTGERAYDLEQLGRYYKISDRLIMPAPVSDQQGVPEQVMARVYNVFDAMISTTQGEGWGLPQMEGMACGVPQIVPRWSALEEWATAAMLVSCSSTAATPQAVNVIGGIADRRLFCVALDQMYRNKDVRAQHVADGLQLVKRPEYRWPSIGKSMLTAIDQAIFQQPVDTQKQQEQPA